MNLDSDNFSTVQHACGLRWNFQYCECISMEPGNRIFIFHAYCHFYHYDNGWRIFCVESSEQCKSFNRCSLTKPTLTKS